MASTYEPIATTTVSGTSTATVTFSSIAGTYTDLILISNLGIVSGSVSDFKMTFNSDTANNYSSTYLYGNGTSAISGNGSSQASALVGRTTTALGTMLLQIMNYSNTTTYKTVVERSGVAGNDLLARVNIWRSTSAITSISIATQASTFFANGSTFTLYGIAAA